MSAARWICVAAWCGLASASTQDPVTITLGRASAEAEAMRETLQSIAAGIQRHLPAGEPAIRIQVRVEPTLAALREAIRTGAVDLAIGPAAALLAMRQSSIADPVAIPAGLDGESAYPSLFFARRDSAVTSLAALRGRVIAFDEQDSATGYHLPRCALQKLGIRLEPTMPGSRPSGDAAGYVFGRAKLNVVAWVFHRKVDAGVLSQRTWDQMVTRPAAMREQLIEIGRTEPFPRQAIAIRRGLSAGIASRIQGALQGMQDSESGRRALEAADWRRLTILTPQALRRLDDRVRACGVDSSWR